MQVWYIESRVPEALDTLDNVLDRLKYLPGFLGGELLSSPDQPGLTLLQTRWDGFPPRIGLPAGARAWVFHVARVQNRVE